jgi:hypothetical protein
MGCYAYLEPARDGPVPGTQLRLALTDSGTLVLRGMLGERAEALTGRLVADSSGVLLVRAMNVSYRSGDTMEWRGEQLAIPKSLVSSVLERQFSAGRTALLGSALTIAILAARKVLSGAGDGTNTAIGFPRPGGQ